MARFFRVTTLFFFVTSLGVEWPPFRRRQQVIWIMTFQSAFDLCKDVRSRLAQCLRQAEPSGQNVWPKWSWGFRDELYPTLPSFPLVFVAMKMPKRPRHGDDFWKVKFFNQNPNLQTPGHQQNLSECFCIGCGPTPRMQSCQMDPLIRRIHDPKNEAKTWWSRLHPGREPYPM